MDTICTSRFYWDKTTKQFVVDISNLKGHNLFGRIYNDACDVGFAMKSTKTGDVVTVCCYDTIRSNDDTVGWVFKPISEAQDFTVMVFND